MAPLSLDTVRALAPKAWPFEEALKLVERYKDGPPEKGYVLFETGYGPSGLPHIGTFGEVARTMMVRRAFEAISGIPTKLICFSDDMDGLRKVPDNVPEKEMLAAHLGKPLTDVPDPFGTHSSFGAHNNARLQSFLDAFGFDYEFRSATEAYKSGAMDRTLLKILKHYEKIIGVILPTLGEDRRKTYSPFLPICPKTGVVLQVPVEIVDKDAGLVSFADGEGERHTVPVTGGRVKCQWKVDWAMRWDALDVDYEMAGKDLIESVKLSSIIRRILGGRPPEGFIYELFLDEAGEKISKSKGNGITIEDWLAYASPESLALYMYQAPKRAKRLYFDVIPKAVDEYYGFAAALATQSQEERLANPAHHIHAAYPKAVAALPAEGLALPVSFALLLNLAGTAHTRDKAVLWGFVSAYAPGVSAGTHPALDRLMDYAFRYYETFIEPTCHFRAPDERERAAFADLLGRLEALPDTADGETIQAEFYAVGKAHGFENLRDWFKANYECLFGQPQGPRMGTFFALYGLAASRALIRKILAGEHFG